MSVGVAKALTNMDITPITVQYQWVVTVIEINQSPGSSVVEHVIGNDEVVGSIPTLGSVFIDRFVS